MAMTLMVSTLGWRKRATVDTGIVDTLDGGRMKGTNKRNP